MLKEFKEFAVKGNMLDMAVGIIIGAAFGVLVKSLVDDIVMPIVAALFDAPDFSNLFIVLEAPVEAGVNMESIEAVREAGGVALGYGLFINAIIAFLIVAVALFFVVKGMNRLKREQEEAAVEETPAEAEPTAEQQLLALREVLLGWVITGPFCMGIPLPRRRARTSPAAHRFRAAHRIPPPSGPTHAHRGRRALSQPAVREGAYSGESRPQSG